MRLTDFLRSTKRQVQYCPDLVPLFGGSVTATILFGQLLYWQDKGSDPEGWIYKSQAELTRETALSREEQETARKKLRDVGVLKERRKGIPCRLWFLLDLDKVNELWEKSQQYSQYGQKPQTRMGESRRQGWGNPADKDGGIPQTTTIDYAADDAKSSSSKAPSPPAAAAASPAADTQNLLPGEVEELLAGLPPGCRTVLHKFSALPQPALVAALQKIKRRLAKIPEPPAYLYTLLSSPDAVSATAEQEKRVSEKDKALKFYQSLPPGKQEELMRLGQITPGGRKDPVYTGWCAIKADPEIAAQFAV